MKKFARLVPIGFLLVLFLSSCATTARKEVPYFDFQGMADSGVIVVTVDAQKESELIKGVLPICKSLLLEPSEFLSRLLQDWIRTHWKLKSWMPMG